MKNLNIILVIAATAVIFWLSPAKAQVNNGTLLDSLSEEDELLDSNLVYKEMYEDSLKDQGNWVKIVKSDFIKEVNGNDTELDELSTSGNDDFVYVWRPYVMDDGPYVNGRWVFTYDGWVWISYYSWGSYCYNYGRWWFSPYYGWVWIPGRVWAPNWCYWREYGHYYGWHPYGPRIHWRNHHGHHHNHVIITHPSKWVFVSKKKLNERITKTEIVKTGLKDIVKNSKRINEVNNYDEKIKYVGPEITALSKETGRKINPESNSDIRTKYDKEIKEYNTKTVTSKEDNNNNGTKSGNNSTYNGNSNRDANNNNGYKESNRNSNTSRESNKNSNTSRESNKNSNTSRESNRSGNNGSRETNRSGNNGSRESNRSGNRETNRSGNNGSRESNKNTTPKKMSSEFNESKKNDANTKVSTKTENKIKKEIYTAPKTETKVKQTYTPPKTETKVKQTYTPPKTENKIKKESYTTPKTETKVKQTYTPPKTENRQKTETYTAPKTENRNTTKVQNTQPKKESSNSNTSVRKK